MKYHKIFFFVHFSLWGMQVIQATEPDPELTAVLETLKNTDHLPNKNFPNLPLTEDFIRIEQNLHVTLPSSLKQYQLTFGNQVFVPCPATASNKEGQCPLENLIKEGREKKIPDYHLTFCREADDYFCIGEKSGLVYHYTVTPHIKLHNTYDNLSSWINQWLLRG